MIGREEFEVLVEEGLAAIPEKFQKLLNNVGIVIEDEPTEAQRRKMRLRADSTLLGLYEGIPQSRRGANYSWVLPDKITIFMNPILAMSRDLEDAKRMVRDTVWHEIAHHFGMDEMRVRNAERRRRNSRS